MKLRHVMAIAACLLVAWAILSPVIAQQRARSLQTSGTVTLTDSFQTIKTADDQRRGCLFQNKGTNTLFVFYGALASATKDGSFEVLTKLYFSTNVGGVNNSDTISITGTTGDKWVLNCM